MADSKTKDSEKLPDDIRAMSFEEAMAGLEEIVRKLESGQVGLEDSIDMYTRGAQLKSHCQAKLAAAQEKVDRIVVGPGGSAAGVEPLESD